MLLITVSLSQFTSNPHALKETSGLQRKHQQNNHVQGGPKIWHHFFLYALTLPNVNRFSKLFHLPESGENL